MVTRSHRSVGDASVGAGRGAGQTGWYTFIADLVAGHSVIDVGCGLGKGLEILSRRATTAHGQDLDPRLERPGVRIGPVEEIADASYDFVACVDVVEHVEQDAEFLRQLVRIARRGVVVTTPLSVLGRPVWEFHIREYRFPEFVSLTSPLGACTYFKGTPSGDQIFRIPDIGWFQRLHGLLNNPVTNIPVRALQKCLPTRLRNLAHQAVLIEKPRS